jgi:hypothetical protein
MSFLLSFVGFIVLIAGLAWIATMLGVAQGYVMVAAMVLLAVGLVFSFTRMRVKDPVA